MRLKALRIRTRYWRPGTDYVKEVVDAVKAYIDNGDVVTVSEKAISTASGAILDESIVTPGRVAYLLASFWTTRIWGGPLGSLTKLRDYTLRRLREYPKSEGAMHKQVALCLTGILQSLRHYSEGGIDASNLPYSYVSLPLKSPMQYAQKIREALHKERKEVTVIIVDGDSTFTWRNLHISPRHVQTPGLIHIGGFLTFVLGRALGLRSRSTPIALSGGNMNPDWIITLANVAHRVRGYGAGRTVWDMAKSLGVELTGVTWNMLDQVSHYPIVILREIPTEG